MRLNRVLFVIISLLFFSAAAQQMVFTYDAAGNRNGRQMVADRSRQFPRMGKRLVNRADVTVYPTVTSDVVTIAVGWDVSQEQAKFRVCDLMGAVITEQNIETQRSVVSFYGLSQGMYFIVIVRNGKTETFKIIKQ